MKNKTQSKFIKSVSALCIYVFSQLAFANGETPVSAGLQYITQAMYGATGIMIATIAIMVVGLLCLTHFLKWTMLGFTIMGISIIFGAGSIVSGLTSLIPRG